MKDLWCVAVRRGACVAVRRGACVSVRRGACVAVRRGASACRVYAGFYGGFF